MLCPPDVARDLHMTCTLSGSGSGSGSDNTCAAIGSCKACRQCELPLLTQQAQFGCINSRACACLGGVIAIHMLMYIRPHAMTAYTCACRQSCMAGLTISQPRGENKQVHNRLGNWLLPARLPRQCRVCPHCFQRQVKDPHWTRLHSPI